MRLVFLSPLLLLAACATPAPRVETVAIAPPSTLLTCKAAPASPKEATRQSEVARYIVRLHEAGADCRAKLGAVRDWVAAEATPTP